MTMRRDPPPGVMDTDLPTLLVGPPSANSVSPRPVSTRGFEEYEVLEEIGRGGMGVVYRARDRRLPRLVALKCLRGDHGHQRFRVEAEAVARLQHPNIVQVYEVGEQAGSPFLALEYLGGGTLAAQFAGRPWPEAECASLIATLAGAVQHAHSNGILHRDLKPGNVLFTADGLPKVVDFGLAKILSQPDSQTRHGDVLGTPEYMAPEQAGGATAALGPAADVYSLGVILYELLTGHVPFQGESPLDTLFLVRTMEPVRPRQLRPTLSRDLETICLKCLAKEPERRYESAADLAADLGRFRRHEPSVARSETRLERGVRWCRRQPALAALSAALLVAVVAGAAGIGWNWLAVRRANYELRRTTGHLVLERGLNLCRHGEVGRGLLWLTHGLEVAPEDDLEFRTSLRTLVGGWQREVRPLHAVLAHDKPVRSAAVAPDGRWALTADVDGAVRRWDLSVLGTGGPGVPVPSTLWKVQAPKIWLSPDGRVVAAVSRSGEAALWDAATGELRCSLNHGAPVGLATFRPDGRVVATSGVDGRVRLWEVGDGRPTGRVFEHPGSPHALAFSPDGRTLLVAYDLGHARLWNTETGQAMGDTTRHPREVEGIAFHPTSGAYATACRDGVVRLRHLAFPNTLHSLTLDDDAVAVAFSPDGKIVATACDDHTVSFWDPEKSERLGEPLHHPGDIKSLSFTTDGTFLMTACGDGMVRLWGVARGLQPTVRLPEPDGKAIQGLAYGPDGRHLYAAGRQVTRHNLALGRPEGAWWHEAEAIGALAVAPAGDWVATGGYDGTVRLWDPATGKQSGPSLAFPTGWWVRSLEFSPDGRWLLAAGGDYARGQGEARLWDVATRRLLRTLRGHEREVTAVAIGPDGRLAATASRDHTVRLWDLASGDPVGEPLPHSEWVEALAFTPDGTTLLTGSRDRVARFWDVTTGRPRGEGLRATGRISALAFRPDGRLVALGQSDGTVALWEVASRQPVGQPLFHQSPLMNVAFAPGGGELATATEDGIVTRWVLPPLAEEAVESLRTWVEAHTGRRRYADGRVTEMSATEWRQNLMRIRGRVQVTLE